MKCEAKMAANSGQFCTSIGTLRFHDAFIYYAGGSDHVSTKHARGS